MKIFAMNDYDWMAGENLEAATAEYLKTYGGDSGMLDEPHELTDAEMDRLILHDGDEEQPDCSFREGLQAMIAQGTQFPILFASTEY
jgi:hypothetical protein